MRPADLQIIGGKLAVKWEDGSENFMVLEKPRRGCPRAGCRGETDILGNGHKNPGTQLAPAAFQLKRIVSVGGHAIQPVWADGHDPGIYPFDYLKHVAEVKK